MATLLFAQNAVEKTAGNWWCLLGLTDSELNAGEPPTISASVIGYDTSGSSFAVMTAVEQQLYEPATPVSGRDGRPYAYAFRFELTENISRVQNYQVELSFDVNRVVRTLTVPVNVYTSSPPSGIVGVPLDDPHSPRYVLFDTASQLSIPFSNLGLSGSWTVVGATNNVNASVSGSNLVVEHSRLNLMAGQPCGFFDVTMTNGSQTNVLKFVLVTNYLQLNSVQPATVTYTDLGVNLQISFGPRYDNIIPSSKRYKFTATFDNGHSISSNVLGSYPPSFNATFTMSPSWTLDYYNVPSRMIVSVQGENFNILGESNESRRALFVTVPDHGFTPVPRVSSIDTGRNFCRSGFSPLVLDLSDVFDYPVQDAVFFELAGVETSDSQLAAMLADIRLKKGEWWSQEGQQLKVHLPQFSGITTNVPLTLLVYGKNIFGRTSTPVRLYGFYFREVIDSYNVVLNGEQGATVTLTHYATVPSYNIPAQEGEFGFNVSTADTTVTIQVTKLYPNIYGRYDVQIPLISGKRLKVPINFVLNAPVLNPLPSNLTVREAAPVQLELSTYVSEQTRTHLECNVISVSGPIVAVVQGTQLQVILSPNAGEVLDGTVGIVNVSIVRKVTNTKGELIESEGVHGVLIVFVTNKPPKFKFSSIDIGTVPAGSTVELDLSQYLETTDESDVIQNVSCTLPFVSSYLSTSWRLRISPSQMHLGVKEGILTVVDSANARGSVPIRVTVVPAGQIVFNLPSVIPAQFAVPIEVYLGNYLQGISELYVRSFELLEGPGEIKKV